MTSNPNIVIVIPYYNGLNYLKNAIRTILDYTMSSVKILIVDNASDEPVNFDNDRIRVVRNRENLGFTKAINQGIKLYPNADIIPFNSDCEARSGWMTNLIRCVYSDAKVALSCPRHKITNVKDTSINNRTSPKPFFTPKGYRIMDWAGFTAVYIRRDAINDIGLLDEKYFHYSSDEEWCRRARSKGWSILWASKAIVYHVGMVSFTILKKKNPKLVKDKIDKKFIM